MAAAGDDGKLQPTSLRDEVYHLLRRRILSHEYPPGYRFDLTALETRLGISRTPLKEALHRLAADGLVEIRPRRGTFVTSLNATEVAESFEVRRILECGVAERIVCEATDAELAALRSIYREMEKLLVHDDYHAIIEAYIEHDRELHKRLMSFSRNQRLQSIYYHVDTHLQIARIQQHFSLPDSMQTQQEHDAILTALEKRDAPALLSAIRAHIDASQHRILRALNYDG